MNVLCGKYTAVLCGRYKGIIWALDGSIVIYVCVKHGLIRSPLSGLEASSSHCIDGPY